MLYRSQVGIRGPTGQSRTFGNSLQGEFVVPLITRVLEPIDSTATFGEDPDLAVVDIHVRTVMQKAHDDLGSRRRFPVLG